MATAAVALVIVSVAGAAPGDPVATDDFVTTTSGVSVTFNPLANDVDTDGGTLRMDRLGNFTGAELLQFLSSDGITGVTEFISQPGMTGVFGFQYALADDNGGAVDKAFVRVSVRAVDIPTVAGAGAYGVESGQRTHFELTAGPSGTGIGTVVGGTFFIERFRGEHIRFEGLVTSLSGTGPNAAMGGTGTWNGTPGYSFTAELVEKGEPGGFKGDRLGVEVRDPSGAVVYTTGGANPISGGNISVL